MALLAPLSGSADRIDVGRSGSPVSRVRLFRPCVLGFSLLAFAVALWGYSYRLSLYRHLPERALRIPAAKLFVEHRNAARASVEKAQAPPRVVPLVPCLLRPQPQPMERARALSTAPAPTVRTARAQVPSRSPPVPSSFAT